MMHYYHTLRLRSSFGAPGYFFQDGEPGIPTQGPAARLVRSGTATSQGQDTLLTWHRRPSLERHKKCAPSFASPQAQTLRLDLI